MNAMHYPESKPFNEGTLSVGGYTLPYKEYGNPKGIPIVSLHGGPGAGSSPDDHRIFDPKAFHIIVYDQRGAGESTPGGGVENNTPDILADDIEVLRKHLNIAQWHVYGGSWGSALSLLYAEKYPEKVKTLTLYGIYLMRKEDDALRYELARILRPEAYMQFKAVLLPGDQDNAKDQGDAKDDVARMQEAYYQMLMNPDPAVHNAVVAASGRFFDAISALEPNEGGNAGNGAKRLNSERIELSIARNHRLDPDDRLLRDIGKIRHIPTKIVHGRYDMICPPKIAQDLKQAFPEAELEMVTAGHCVPEPEIVKAMVRATNNIRDTGSPLPKKNTEPKNIISHHS